jgi:hypothetical protein
VVFLITPPRATEWSVSRDDLVRLLTGRWPDAELGFEELVTRDVVWTRRTSDGELEGSQDVAGQVHYLDGPLPAVAEHAVWWRSRVPAEQELVLCDEGYNVVVALESGSRAEDLLEALGKG